MTVTDAVVCCVPGSIGVESKAAALLAASASGCGALLLSAIAVTRPSERFAAAASTCAFARAFATAALSAWRYCSVWSPLESDGP